jgi:hypothetical protein
MTPIDCPHAIVGGGWAGVYSAWRLAIDSALVTPSDVCLFEARTAVGGRTYSVGVDGMTLDIGAYRFGFGMHLPADLIMHKLKLNVTCYEPSCAPDAEFNETLYRIVDADGRNAGYATAMRLMTSQLDAAGARIFYSHELTGIYDAASTQGDVQTVTGEPIASLLHFAGGEVARSSSIMLNLPRGSIERLDPASVLFANRPNTQILTNCTVRQTG